MIGGGFIGLELASSAAALGCAVTVIELGPRLMGRAVPARVAAVMAQRHVAAGVDIRCGTGVTGLAQTASGVTITLAEGATVEADVVVAGVGAAPETSLAETAGIEIADGIAVDARFATSAPDVFAAGDCCRYPHPLYDDRPLRLESWRAAQEHGAAAARAMLGGTEPYAGVPWFWTDQHDYHPAGRGPDRRGVRRGRPGPPGRDRDLVRPGGRREAGGRRRGRPGQLGGQGHQAGRDADRAARGPGSRRPGRSRRGAEVRPPLARGRLATTSIPVGKPEED